MKAEPKALHRKLAKDEALLHSTAEPKGLLHKNTEPRTLLHKLEKLVLSTLLVLVLSSLTLLAACGTDTRIGSEKHGQIVELEIWEESAMVQVNFEVSAVTYYRNEGSDPLTVVLHMTEADLVEYRSTMTQMTDQIFADDAKQGAKNTSTEDDQDTQQVLCKIIVTYEDGQRLVYNGFSSHPDGWTDLVFRTNLLLGFDYFK
jgi:uncharacterized protein YuzE